MGAPELPDGFGIEPLDAADVAAEGHPDHDCAGADDE